MSITAYFLQTYIQHLYFLHSILTLPIQYLHFYMLNSKGNSIELFYKLI